MWAKAMTLDQQGQVGSDNRNKIGLHPKLSPFVSSRYIYGKKQYKTLCYTVVKGLRNSLVFLHFLILHFQRCSLYT